MRPRPRRRGAEAAPAGGRVRHLGRCARPAERRRLALDRAIRAGAAGPSGHSRSRRRWTRRIDSAARRRAAPSPTPPPGTSLVAAAETAEGLLHAGGDDPAWRPRVVETLTRSRAGRARALAVREAAERDRRLVETLDANRLSLPTNPDGKWDYPRWISNDLAALREYGLDVESLNEDEAVQRVNQAGALARDAIVAALDDMARRADDDLAETFLAITLRVDPDPLRNRLRVAMVRHDVAELRSLARDKEAAVRLSCPSLTQLADRLVHLGVADEAASLLRTAAARHPSDFWLHVELADLLMDPSRPRIEEAATHLMAARLKPKPAMMARFGLMLVRAGRADEALPVLRQAIELDPSRIDARGGRSGPGPARPDGGVDRSEPRGAPHRPPRVRPTTTSACALDRLGRTDEAIAAFREATLLRLNDAGAHREHGACLAKAGRRSEARDALNRAIRLKPDDAACPRDPGPHRPGAGRTDEAEAELKLAAELGIDDDAAAEQVARNRRRASGRRASSAACLPCSGATTAPPGSPNGWNSPNSATTGPSTRPPPACWPTPRPPNSRRSGPRRSTRATSRPAAPCWPVAAGAPTDPPPDDSARPAGEPRRLEWLRVDLATLVRSLEGGKPDARAWVRRVLNAWKSNRDLAGVRDAPELAKIPEPELAPPGGALGGRGGDAQVDVGLVVPAWLSWFTARARIFQQPRSRGPAPWSRSGSRIPRSIRTKPPVVAARPGSTVPDLRGGLPSPGTSLSDTPNHKASQTGLPRNPARIAASSRNRFRLTPQSTRTLRRSPSPSTRLISYPPE